jgi:hypothetical protein
VRKGKAEDPLCAIVAADADHGDRSMPPLRLARQERFAQGVASGLSATAYQQAGYKPSRTNASTLLQKQDISERVAEILAERSAIHSAGVAQAIQAKPGHSRKHPRRSRSTLAGAEGDEDWKAMVSGVRLDLIAISAGSRSTLMLVALSSSTSRRHAASASSRLPNRPAA